MCRVACNIFLLSVTMSKERHEHYQNGKLSYKAVTYSIPSLCSLYTQNEEIIISNIPNCPDSDGMDVDHGLSILLKQHPSFLLLLFTFVPISKWPSNNQKYETLWKTRKWFWKANSRTFFPPERESLHENRKAVRFLSVGYFRKQFGGRWGRLWIDVG